jgi:hypothetical protein
MDDVCISLFFQDCQDGRINHICALTLWQDPAISNWFCPDDERWARIHQDSVLFSLPVAGLIFASITE